MRALLVVMPDILFENLLEVALTEYKDVIQTLSSYGAHEAFGDGVGFWRAYRGADDAHSLRAKHLVERSRVLGVAVMDHELDLSQSIFYGQVASLLGDPGRIGMAADPGQVRLAGQELDEEKDVDRL